MKKFIKSIYRLFAEPTCDSSNPNDGINSDSHPDNETPTIANFNHLKEEIPDQEIKTNYLAFDIEIAKLIPGDLNEWKRYRPLGITCAATLMDGTEPYIWCSRNSDGTIAEKMSPEDLSRMVLYLDSCYEKGWEILTWNGLGFDFDVLAEESGESEICKYLASEHVDLMFHLFCEKGYPLSLNTVALGMGVEGKLDGMSAEQARQLWHQGHHEKVFKYVAQDVKATLEVAKSGLVQKKICWVSKNGRQQEVSLPYGWFSVEEALEIPEPDISWMSDPISRRSFYSWINITNSLTPIQSNNPVCNVMRNSPKASIGTYASHQKINQVLNIDEINGLLSERDEISDYGDLEYDSDLNRESEEYQSTVVYCSCPICCGVPHLDCVFQDTFKESEEREGIDDYDWDED